MICQGCARCRDRDAIGAMMRRWAKPVVEYRPKPRRGPLALVGRLLFGPACRQCGDRLREHTAAS